MTESASQPIHFPGERVYPKSVATDPDLEAHFEVESDAIEESVYEAATDAQDPDTILSSEAPPVLSDRAMRVLTSLNEIHRRRDIQRQISDGNRRNLSTNRAATVRQFGSLTLLRSQIRKSKY